MNVPMMNVCLAFCHDTKCDNDNTRKLQTMFLLRNFSAQTRSLKNFFIRFCLRCMKEFMNENKIK